MTSPATEPLPDDIATLKAMLLAERQAHRAGVHNQALLIEKLEHQITRLRHERFGQSSERRALLDQLELQLFELKEDQAQAEAAIQAGAPPTEAVQAFTRRRPARRPLAESAHSYFTTLSSAMRVSATEGGVAAGASRRTPRRKLL